jgi:hypothetical protein
VNPIVNVMFFFGMQRKATRHLKAAETKTVGKYRVHIGASENLRSEVDRAGVLLTYSANEFYTARAV